MRSSQSLPGARTCLAPPWSAGMQVLYPPERYAELAGAPPQRKQPLGLQNVGNR